MAVRRRDRRVVRRHLRRAALRAPADHCGARDRCRPDTDARERRQRVDQYLARLNHIEFLPLVAAASDLLNTGPLGQAEALRAWLAGRSVDRLRTLAFLNFFEEVAGQYNAGMLDAGAANRELVPTAVHYWEVGGWFIGRLKAEQPRAFDEWEAMVNALRLAELR